MTAMASRKRVCSTIALFVLCIILAAGTSLYAGTLEKERGGPSRYEEWHWFGTFMAKSALESLEIARIKPQQDNLVVMTNAVCAEVKGESTQALLDGLSAFTGASRGRHTLVEVHSASWEPLWCAVYDKKSGYSAYLEVDPKLPADSNTCTPELFCRMATERIDAEYLFNHSVEWQTKSLVF
jgi:hypothetical protein